MKKIAIFTWFNYDCNCGQTLQAYALQKKIDQYRVYSVIIDYVYLGKEVYHNWIIWPIYRCFDDIRKKRVVKRLLFNSFVANNMRVSKKLYSYDEICNYLNLKKIKNFLLGSDQIWNPQAGSIPRAMYLDFSEGIKCSYSPSMCEEFDKKKYLYELEKLYKALADFTYIGVREESAKRIIENIGEEYDISVIMDPVFLFDAAEWKSLLKIGKKEDNYILVYCLGELTQDLYRSINEVSGNRNIIYIGSDYSNNIPLNWKKIKNLDPKRFVELIEGAYFVIGDSFHMVAFSIIFRKQFAVFSSCRKYFKSNMDRVTCLLERLNLLERYNNVGCIKELIDYSLHEEIIEKNISYSKSFLEKIINSFSE